jgi:hypothetical protein
VVCSLRLVTLGILLPAWGGVDRPRRNPHREASPRAAPGVACRAN